MKYQYSMPDAVNRIIEVVEKSTEDGADKQEILRWLKYFKSMDMNLHALSHALMDIRALTQNNSLTKPDIDECRKILSSIHTISDGMHNVGSFMASGIECDAMGLLMLANEMCHVRELVGLEYHQNPSFDTNKKNLDVFKLTEDKFFMVNKRG